MIAGEHFSSRSIRMKTSELCSSWRRLENKMADRGDKLRQAGQQEQLMELLQVNTWSDNEPLTGVDGVGRLKYLLLYILTCKIILNTWNQEESLDSWMSV